MPSCRPAWRRSGAWWPYPAPRSRSMSRFGSAAVLVLTLGACAVPAVQPAPPAAGVDAERLAELHRRQDCFGLRDALEGAPGGAVADFYRAAVAVAFNRPDEAIGEVRRFLASPEAAA